MIRDLRLYLASWLLDGTGWVAMPEQFFGDCFEAYLRQEVRAQKQATRTDLRRTDAPSAKVTRH